MSNGNRNGSGYPPTGSGRPMGGGGGRGRGGGSGAGPGGNCVCPNCGQVVPHHLGVPCNQQKCPKCGSFLIRKI